MTNHIDTDRISASSDATMMHILTHGFSDLLNDRRDGFRATKGGAIKRVSGRIGRTENGWWHRDTTEMSAARERLQAAKRRDEDALLAQDIRDLCGSSKRTVVMRNVEVVHVRTTKAGIRHVVKREVCTVECKRPRSK